MSYIEITDNELNPEEPITSSLGKRWRDNPIALVQWDIGDVRPNFIPGTFDFFGVGNFQFAVPLGVRRVLLELSGAGGGGGAGKDGIASDGDGSAGGDTTVTGGLFTVSASGGPGGLGRTHLSQDGSPQGAISSRNGGGQGGKGGWWADTINAEFAIGEDGFSGDHIVIPVSVVPEELLDITVGSGGAGGVIGPNPGGNGGPGQDGFARIIY